MQKQSTVMTDLNKKNEALKELFILKEKTNYQNDQEIKELRRKTKNIMDRFYDELTGEEKMMINTLHSTSGTIISFSKAVNKKSDNIGYNPEKLSVGKKMLSLIDDIDNLVKKNQAHLNSVIA